MRASKYIFKNQIYKSTVNCSLAYVHKKHKKSYLAKHRTRFSSDQFHAVGVSFVGHKAATGRKAVGYFQEIELLAAIDYHILGEPTEMHRSQRSPVQKIS